MTLLGTFVIVMLEDKLGQGGGASIVERAGKSLEEHGWRSREAPGGACSISNTFDHLEELGK